MSIKSSMKHWVTCDGCGDDFDGDEGTFVYDTPELAVQYIDDADWRVIDGKHACPKCTSWDNEGNYVIKPRHEPGGSES